MSTRVHDGMKILTDPLAIAREMIQISLSARIWDDEGCLLGVPEVGYPRIAVGDVEYRVRNPTNAVLYITKRRTDISVGDIIPALQTVLRQNRDALRLFTAQTPRYELATKWWRSPSNSVHTLRLSRKQLDACADPSQRSIKVGATVWHLLPAGALMGGDSGDVLTVAVKLIYDVSGITHARELARATGGTIDTYTIDRNIWIGYDRVHPTSVLLTNIGSLSPVAMCYNTAWSNCRMQAFKNVRARFFRDDYDPSLGDTCDVCMSKLYDDNYVYRSRDTNITICPWCLHSPAVRTSDTDRICVVKFPTSVESLIAREDDPVLREMFMHAHKHGVTVAQLRMPDADKSIRCVYIGQKYVAFPNISKFIRNRAYEYIGDKIAFQLRTGKLLFHK